MDYRLLRRQVGSDEWLSTAVGDVDFVTELLKMNLVDFTDYEWKLEPELPVENKQEVGQLSVKLNAKEES